MNEDLGSPDSGNDVPDDDRPRSSGVQFSDIDYHEGSTTSPAIANVERSDVSPAQGLLRRPSTDKATGPPPPTPYMLDHEAGHTSKSPLSGDVLSANGDSNAALHSPRKYMQQRLHISRTWSELLHCFKTKIGWRWVSHVRHRARSKSLLSKTV